jgi:hypothetical protein
MSPAPGGPPNNPNGVNSWEGFGTEEPYGQATAWARETRVAPLVAARVASGPINAPKQTQRRAIRGMRTALARPVVPAPVAVPTLAEAPLFLPRLPSWPDSATVWQRLAEIPGISPLAAAYAQAAARAVTPPAYVVSPAEVVHPNLGAPPTGPPPPELARALRGPA